MKLSSPRDLLVPMRATLSVIVASMLLPLGLASTAPDALAHGGSYRGPGGSVGIVGRGAGGGTGGRSQGGVSGVSVERWELWWAFNREDFLWSSGRRAADVPVESGDPQLTMDQKVRGQLLPVLEKALQDRDVDLRDTAAFVLGKTGLPEIAIPLLKDAADDRVESVVEAVVLGLGTLAHEDGIPVLIEILEGRRTNARTRAYAGLALGFIGGDTAYDALKAGVGFTKKRSEPLAVRNMDVDSARVLAMGLTRTAEARRHLIHQCATAGNRRDNLKMLLPLALQRSGDPDAAPAVVPLLSDNNVHVRRSAAIALGRLATYENAEIVQRLQFAYLKDADNSVKNFAAISLGRIGGQEAVDFLMKHFDKTPSITRAFAALALGIAGDDRAASVLREAFAESSEQSFRGACAIALGILGDDASGDTLLKALQKEKNDTFRGNLAIALGLLEYDEAAETLVAVVRRERDPKIRGEAAEALALIGGDTILDTLVKVLNEDDSDYMTSSLAVALGRLRDAQSFDALLAIASNERASTRLRSFALAAIGRIIDPSVPPTLSRVVVDHNYRIEMGYVYDLLTLL